MQDEAKFTPDAACMILVRDEDLYVVSAFWSAYGGGHGYHKVCAKHSLSDAQGAPVSIGRAVQSALKVFYVVPRTQDEPERDALEELSAGNLARFLKGARRVLIAHDREGSVMTLTGGYSPTKDGFENLKNCVTVLPDRTAAEPLGKSIMDMLRSIDKRVAR